MSAFPSSSVSQVHLHTAHSFLSLHHVQLHLQSLFPNSISCERESYWTGGIETMIKYTGLLLFYGSENVDDEWSIRDLEKINVTQPGDIFL